MAEIIAPQGRIGLIDDPEPLDLRLSERFSPGNVYPPHALLGHE
jgi:hypothetical protein